jgi:Na+-driven multidrug efflux pump
MAAATVVVVGNELGAGNLARGRLYGDRMGILSLFVGLLAAVLVLAASPAVLHYMKLTDGAHALLHDMFFVLSLYMIGRCVNTIVINGVFTAGGDTLFDFYSLGVCMWCLAVPLAFLGAFVFHWHPVLVYACTCVDEVGKLPWVYLHFRRYKWVKNLTR